MSTQEESRPAAAPPGDPQMLPQLTVCLVTYDRRDDLDCALKSVFQHAGVSRLEVIVVDNNSSDDTLSMIAEKYPSVIVVRNSTNEGYAPAMNIALERARGEFVLTLSSDAELRPGAVGALISFMQSHPAAGLAGPRTLDAKGEVVTTLHHPSLMISVWSDIVSVKQWLRRHLGLRRLVGKLLPNSSGLTSDYTTTHPAPVVDGGSLMIRRRALEVVGLLDPLVVLGPDDYDWCFRMRSLGYETWFVAESEIIHRTSPKEKIREMSPKFLRVGLPGLCYVYDKHHGRFWTKLFCLSACILNKKWQIEARRQYGKDSLHVAALRESRDLCLHPERYLTDCQILWRK